MDTAPASGPTALKLKEILVPIDFSEASKKALKYAGSVAEQFGAKLTLLFVAEPPVYPDFAYTPLFMENEQVIKVAKGKLDLLCKQQAIEPHLIRKTLVGTGVPFQEIARAAQNLKADLIIIATKGRTAFKRALLGSTAERVVRHAPCPVLALRAGENGSIVRIPAALESAPARLKIKRILAPTDFSAPSKKAFRYATKFAEQFGATLTLLHVVEPIVLLKEAYGFAEVPDIASAGLRKDVISKLATLAQKEIEELVPVKPLVRSGKPYQEIVDVAKERDIDLIIIATHGYSGLKHLFLGSTAERVVRHAPCPVLIVREREHEFV
jgi:nucleotide-binding universal stress UspA family protein